jgi:hypothetical protein
VGDGTVDGVEADLELLGADLVGLDVVQAEDGVDVAAVGLRGQLQPARGVVVREGELARVGDGEHLRALLRRQEQPVPVHELETCAPITVSR